MAHGSKKWIRDWRGRIKRSTDRTQKDWQGALGASRSRDRILRRGLRRWQPQRQRGIKDDTCPQCKFLNKNRPVIRWSVIRELGTILCYSLHDNPTYLALKKEWGWKLDAQAIWPPREFDRFATKEAVKIYDPHIGKYTRWGYFSKTRYRIYTLDTVHDIRDTKRKGISRVIPVSHPFVTCEPCRRKEKVAWGSRNGRVLANERHYTIARRLEEQARKAAIRNLMQRAKYDEDLYDLIPNRITKGWLD